MNAQIPNGSIVVAVDGSAHSERALRWAAEQAFLERRHLVTVTAGDDGLATADEAAALAAGLHPGLMVRPVARPGDPRGVLLGLSSDASLLVVGSRGRGMLGSMLLGSVSAAVSAHSASPVVVCRPMKARHTNPGVLVGVDGTEESLPVIEFAYRVASARGLPLTVLHCFWDAVAAVAAYRDSLGQVVDPPELEELRAVLAESVGGFSEEFPDVPVTFRLKQGLVDEALSSRGEAWDLVVVGRHPMTSISKVFAGSIATSVIERSDSTVAVVPVPSP